MEDRTVHYCEIHVTVKGVTPGDERLSLVGDTRWWYSKVSASDFDDPKAELIYTTRASARGAAINVIAKFREKVTGLQGHCTRMKIEEVTFDTKYGDSL